MIRMAEFGAWLWSTSHILEASATNVWFNQMLGRPFADAAVRMQVVGYWKFKEQPAVEV